MLKPDKITACYDASTGTVVVFAACVEQILLNPDGVAHFCPPKYKEEVSFWSYVQGSDSWQRLPDLPTTSQELLEIDQ